MSNKLYDENSVQDIADAIRSKNGLSSATYKISEMAQAVLDLPAGNTKLGLVTKEQRDLSVARGSYTTIGN
jgi:propanediol dehydratase small subunit